MKIELIEVGSGESLHPTHPELWVRTVTFEPLGPEDWPRVKARLSMLAGSAEILGRYSSTPCKFEVDTWAEDDSGEEREDLGFEQFWVFPKEDRWAGSWSATTSRSTSRTAP